MSEKLYREYILSDGQLNEHSFESPCYICRRTLEGQPAHFGVALLEETRTLCFFRITNMPKPLETEIYKQAEAQGLSSAEHLFLVIPNHQWDEYGVALVHFVSDKDLLYCTPWEVAQSVCYLETGKFYPEWTDEYEKRMGFTPFT